MTETAAFAPTAEQVEALRLFATGESLVIEAGAGTGKTSTLKLLSESAPARRGIYLAFNRSIVDEAKRKMPANVSAFTAHSVAFRAVGKPYAHRLNSNRMRSGEVARMLRLDPIYVTFGDERKVLQPDYLAGLVMRAISVFCNSADDAPGTQHIPYIDGIDVPAADGKRTYANNRAVAKALAPALGRAWADLSSPTGQLRFSHDVYLKIWQLSRPNLRTDFVLFDEAQDASPVMAAAIGYQTCQCAYVGDSQQAIYEWRGAVNALAAFETDQRAYLSQSWRFGEAIAAMANKVLGWIPGAALRLTGAPGMASRIGTVERPDAILCRTNAFAIVELLNAQKAGVKVHLIGGGAEVARFAKAAQELMDRGRTSHPELACFTSWGQVQTYVYDDAQGSELRLMVRLVDEFTPEVIIDALERMPAEAAADLVVSTAHKAKGREWPTVRLAGDFPTEVSGPEEMRLLYVAVTRAQLVLDISRVPLLSDEGGPDDDAEAPTPAEVIEGSSTPAPSPARVRRAGAPTPSAGVAAWPTSGSVAGCAGPRRPWPFLLRAPRTPAGGHRRAAGASRGRDGPNRPARSPPPMKRSPRPRPSGPRITSPPARPSPGPGPAGPARR